jgi:hypothetical protein
VLICYFFEGVSAPIVGSTSLANLADAIGKSPIVSPPETLPIDIDWRTTAAAHIKLTEEEIKSLEEPYLPMAVLGHW